MVTFSNDADILRYEPILFGELHLPGQVLTAGTGGSLTGTTFTAENADFISAQVAAGGVIHLQSADGTLDGAYEIVSVDSATQLTISIVRTDNDSEPIAPPAAENIAYRISTFRPQANEAAFQLTEYFGIRPGNPASSIDTQGILDIEVLRRASVFAVISNVYAMLASKANEENFWKKNLHYQKLFEKARQRVHLSIDSSADGISDVTRSGASVRLVRD
ncbi:MAG: hypothetical protein A2167_02730 [Planctomycetes bacterium RBG_13_46_10]|nr:MAG: hypothetical protein A2167_02730 [Planctomycetes bacterium RBG_13_46_10]